MNKNIRFASVPESKIDKTMFPQEFSHSTTFMFGKIIPLDCMDILPGDVIKSRLSALIRMSTPIAPIMSRIRGSIHCFFVPWRLVWEHTKEFFGENKTSAGPQNTTYTIPSGYLNNNYASESKVGVGSVAHYLGFPLYNSTYYNPTSGGTIQSGATPVSLLKLRGYWLCVNEWYRHQQVQTPITVFTNDVSAGNMVTYWNTIAVKGTTQLRVDAMPADVVKDFDYFVSGTISPEYGPAVALPLGTFAPVVALDQGDVPIVNGQYDLSNTNPKAVATANKGQVTLFTTDVTDQELNLFTDLSQATAATIDDLYYAMAIQSWLHSANYGTRYFERLQVSFGTTNPDLVLDRPQHLGEYKFDINVQQVLSTAGYSASSSTTVGAPGANSQTGLSRVPLYNHSFGEFGFVYVLLSTYQEHTYSQGVDRNDLKQTAVELFWPEFSRLGDQATKLDEIFFRGGNKDSIFNYQEHWAEYRYRKNRVSGLLDKNASGALGFWTLADKYATPPSFNDAWIVENRDAIKDALVTGSTGPDFVADFYFDNKVTRVLPMFTRPGIPTHVR